MEHSEIRSQSTQRIEIFRQFETNSTLVTERVVAHRSPPVESWPSFSTGTFLPSQVSSKPAISDEYILDMITIFSKTCLHDVQAVIITILNSYKTVHNNQVIHVFEALCVR